MNINEALEKKLSEIRRILHAHPELGFKEYETSKRIMDDLEAIGVEDISLVEPTGVVGYIHGRPGKTVLLRSDMDALMIQEENQVSYQSKNSGIMHACGHDVHMTWLLGAAMLLVEQKNTLNGTVKLLFQPAEEGLAGAKKMIEQDVLGDVDLVLGGHVWPSLKRNTMAIKAGPLMASSSKFEIKIFGKGGHGAAPHETNDPILVGTHIYQGLQSIVSRNIDPTKASVLSITQFHGGTTHNIIPDQVFLAGTVRTLENEVVQFIEEKMEKIISGICRCHGAEYEFKFDNYYPVVMNNPEITRSLIEKGQLYFDEVVELEAPVMAGEDFSFYLQKKPGAFFFIGSMEKDNYPLHHPKFDVNEDILLYGAKWYALIADAFLKTGVL